MDEMPRNEACNKTCQALNDLTTKVMVKLKEHDGGIDAALSGVANYKVFMREQRTVNSEIMEFITDTKATEREREKQLNKRDQEIKDDLASHRAAAEQEAQDLSNKIGKKNLWTAMASLAVAFAGVCVSILAIICMFYVARHYTSVDPLDLWQRLQSGQTYTAHNQQSAGKEW